jgi:hypothetical protein
VGANIGYITVSCILFHFYYSSSSMNSNQKLMLTPPIANEIDAENVLNTIDVFAPAAGTSKLRRNLSISDISGKRGGRALRRSVSDLTDESSGSGTDIGACSDFELQIPYSEMVVIAGVCDVPELWYIQNDGDPPSAPIGGRGLRSHKQQRANAKAVFSLHSPHKLLIVTQDVCDLFGYVVVSEICGRALTTLFGPRTDRSAIASGIQSVAMNTVAHHDIVLYNREGEGLMVTATFSPLLSDAETLAGCLLELSPADS